MQDRTADDSSHLVARNPVDDFPNLHAGYLTISIRLGSQARALAKMARSMERLDQEGGNPFFGTIGLNRNAAQFRPAFSASFCCSCSTRA